MEIVDIIILIYFSLVILVLIVYVLIIPKYSEYKVNKEIKKIYKDAGLL